MRADWSLARKLLMVTLALSTGFTIVAALVTFQIVSNGLGDVDKVSDPQSD